MLTRSCQRTIAVSDPWTFSGQVAAIGEPSGAITLVDESTFAISGTSGDILVGGSQGLFVRDSRILSRLELRVNGAEDRAADRRCERPLLCDLRLALPPKAGRADSTLVVFRSRYVGRGMREDIVIRNFGDEPTYCSVELFVQADFANLFAVKEGRVGLGRRDSRRSSVTVFSVLSYKRGNREPGDRASLHAGARSSSATTSVTFEAIVPPHGEWTACIEVHPVIEGTLVVPRYRCGQPVERATPAERLARWRSKVPQVESDDDELRRALDRSAEDLGALRIFDPDYPERVVVAAGAPWFMTVFGRDSLITSWMALIVDPDLALGVLQTLARFQGKRDRSRGPTSSPVGSCTRCGSARLRRCRSVAGASTTGPPTRPHFSSCSSASCGDGVSLPKRSTAFLPNAERALEWIDTFGDADGDGYVEYKRATDRGLANQGWKDSWDGIRYADGTVANAPIALCEVQAYVYSAYLARAHFAHEAGDEATYSRYRSKATRLQDGVQPGFLARGAGLVRSRSRRRQATDRLAHLEHRPLPLDRHRRRRQGAAASPTASCPKRCSPAGGSAPSRRRWAVTTRSAITADLSGRTTRRSSPRGSSRYGFNEPALRIVSGLLDAAQTLGGRLPELFSGLDRSELSAPGPLPDLVLTAGVGCSVTTSVPQNDPAARSVGALREDLALSVASRGDEAAEGRGDTPRGVTCIGRGRRRRRAHRGPASDARARHRGPATRRLLSEDGQLQLGKFARVSARPQGFAVREAADSDADGVIALYAACWGEHEGMVLDTVGRWPISTMWPLITHEWAVLHGSPSVGAPATPPRTRCESPRAWRGVRSQTIKRSCRCST